MSPSVLLSTLLSLLLAPVTHGCLSLKDLGGSGISLGWSANDNILECSGGSDAVDCAIGGPAATTSLSFGKRKGGAPDPRLDLSNYK